MIFALASVVLLAGLGLVLDAGFDFVQRRAMQNAADAAALAGTRLLAQSPASTAIAATVAATAVQNGVPSTADVECWYLTDGNTGGVAACQAGMAPPTNLGTVTGVRATVRERHGTFAMRVVGILTSGTGATSAAQVQVLSSYAGNAVPFLPCGIGTVTADGGALSILNTTQRPLYDNRGRLTGYQEVVSNDASGYASINPARYGYDWTGGLGLGLPKPGQGVAAGSGTPEYVIHGPQVATCGAGSNNFKGLNGHTGTITLPALAYDDTTHAGTKQPLEITSGVRAGPTRQVIASLGCTANNLNGCVLILPVIDDSGPGGTGRNITYAGRLWAAFWVAEVGANEHHAWLIANYPLAGAGATGWTATYTGPTVIRLIP